MRPAAARPSLRAALAGALLLALPAAAAAPACPADRVDRRVTVTHVHDGDTVRLAGGDDLRLIGIDTPELGRDGAPDQPFAAAARTALVRLLAAHGNRLHLRLGAERRDDYGRLLAHAYLPDGRSVARVLIARGLGVRVTVPPNTRHHRCYAAAEARARAAERGVWGLARYRGVPAARLAPDAGGFHVVRGRVRRVGEGGGAFWLELDGLTLRLAKDDLAAHFEGLEPRALTGRRLRVRGWVYRVRGQARMNLRHPASVEWGGTSD